MSDGLIIIVGIIFVFVVWVWTGGPSRPISFSGPFITPLTTVGDVQTGYGTDIAPSGSSSGGASGGSYWSLKSVLGSYAGSAPDSGGSAQVQNPSPYLGRVGFSSGSSGPSYVEPDREYVSIDNGSDGNVDITGWTITSAATGNSVTLPQGAEVAKYRGGAPLKHIVLESGEEAVVTTGESPAGGDSYRETACTRYLDDRSDYDSCVKQYKSDRYFRSGTWLVYLNRTRDLWHNEHDTLRLLDTQGRTVDQYSY